MRQSKLTLMLVGLFGGALPAAGCFITTESDRYTDTEGSANTVGDCPVGAPLCPCTGSGACDDGLVCQEMINICVLPEGCPIGSPGCSCTAGGTCDDGLMCADVEPAPGICVDDDPCLDEFIGTEGCQCTQGGGCDSELDCVSGLCVNLPDPDPTTGGTTDPTGETTTDGGSTTTGGAADESSSGSAADTTGGGGAAPTTGG